LIAILSALLAALAPTGAAAGDDEILIAVAGPLTGRYAEFGRQMQIGAERAIRDLNVSGDQNGGRFRLIVEDDGCDKAQAVAVARRLATHPVAVVIGHHCAGASIAAAAIYAAAGIVQISPGTNAPPFTDQRAGPTIFRLAHRSDREGTISGAYLARTFAGKRVAILHDRTVIGIDLASQTRRAMHAGGLAEVLYSGFIAGEPDYSRLARDLRTHRVDAVYLGAFPSEVRLIRAALRREGLDTVVIGSRLLASGGLEEGLGPELEGVLLSAPLRVLTLPGAARLYQDATPDQALVQASTYAAIEAWAKAVSVESAAGTAVAQRLQQGSFDTVLGAVGFDSKGDATVPFLRMHVWKSGQLVPVP
jgi:branched-chain amino acid transport system substrate-binding protein